MTPPEAGTVARSSSNEASAAQVAPRRVVSFVAGLAEQGARPALVDHQGRCVSYAELAERVRTAAARLGTSRRLVMVEGGNTVDAVVAYLGALAGGHPTLLVPPGGADADRWRTSYVPDVVAAGGQGWVYEVVRESTAHELHPDLALLLTTSGSTGSPKLVRLSHENLDANATAIAHSLHLGPDDRGVTSLPLHYCYGLSVLHSHLAAGASVALTDLSVTDPCFWDRVRDAEVTGLAGVPYTFDLLDRVGFADMDLPHLRYVTQAGGRMAPERVAYWAETGRRQGWDLFVMYGQTEATARMACLPPDQALLRPAAVGRAVAGGSFTIDTAHAPRDGSGEVVYRGPNVMLGYAEGPADLALGGTLTELRTGDLGRLDDEGYLHIVGRAGRFLKLFGLRIDLDDAERLLADHGVEAVCTGTDEVLVVAVEGGAAHGAGPIDTDPIDTDHVRRVTAAAFGLPAAAAHVWVTDHLPRLTSGKPDRVRIREAALADRLAEVGPTDGSQGPPTATIAGIFAAALDRRPATVAGDATFVSLGGDSLSYVEVSVALDTVLDRVPADWHLRAVEELQARADRSAASSTAAAFAPGDGSPPVRRLATPRRFGTMETGLVLRAAAITLIVGTHSGVFMLQGGAHVLLAVAGFNFARFRLFAVDTATHLRGAATSIARIAVPTAVWLAFQFTYAEPFTMARVLLANNYFGTGLWEYWYLEALLQILVVLALVFAVPAVRSFERRHPFGVAVAVLAVATAVRHDALGLVPDQHHMYMTHTIVWCFAAGWAAQRATSHRQRLLVTALTVVAVADFFDSPTRGLVVGIGLLVLIWLPRLPVPRVVRPVVAGLAAASLWIYLTQWAVLVPLVGTIPPVGVAVVALLLGVAATAVAGRVEAALVDRWRHRGTGATRSDRPSREASVS